eukprot:6481060-Amphidinium_carterae.1
MELLEGELGEKALDEQHRNMRKAQAHLNEVPQPPYDANGMEGKGKGKDKKGKGGKDKDQPKGKPKGDGKKGGRTGYRNRDDDPKDTRAICPKFMTDQGCDKGGLCNLKHPTKVGKCLRCGAKGHSVAECLRPRRENPNRPTGGRAAGNPRGGRGRNGRGRGRGGNPRALNSEWVGDEEQPHQEGQDQGEYQYPDADHAQAEEEEYEEGTTWPEDGIEVPQADYAAAAAYGPSSFTAYLCPDIGGVSPVALLTTPDVKPMTPILDTGASHCLLPVSHLTADEAELASRVHLRVANGALTRALMYQNIIYATKVPRPLISVGQVTNSLNLTFLWHGGIPRLILTENGTPFEVIRATLWNSLPCVTENELKSLVEALTTFTLSSRVWLKADWEKALGIPSLRPLELSALPTEGKKDFQVTQVPEDEFANSILPVEIGSLSAVIHEATETMESTVIGDPVDALPRTDAMPSIVSKIRSPEQVVLSHRLPKQPTRTNVVTEDQ